MISILVDNVKVTLQNTVKKLNLLSALFNLFEYYQVMSNTYYIGVHWGL